MIKIVEVGPRDGLQNEKQIIPTEIKFEFIKKLVDAGLRTIEVTSFVKAPAIPQMSDGVELFELIKNTFTDQNLHFPCLVPNLKGFETAQKIGVKEIALFSATSNSFTQKNINATIDESFKRMEEVSSQAKNEGMKMRGYVSTAFGCPYEGKKDIKSLVDVTRRFFELGAEEVSIGDTIGVAVPSQVRDFLKILSQEFDVKKLAMHFHDTRGMAITNILTSLQFGIEYWRMSLC
jgi:hydroxymethylglutaryl-CoA lyase